MPNVADLHRQITAYHEAAHALFALRFGIRVHEIALCYAGPRAGYMRMLSAPLVYKIDKTPDYSPEITWKLLLRDTEHRAMVALAGPLAEAKLLRKPLRSHCCVSDLQRCEQICWDLDRYRRHLIKTRAIAIHADGPVEMANRLRRRTFQTLVHPRIWREVTALADELMGWSRLSGHDAADTVQWTRRVRNQLALPLSLPQSQVPVKSIDLRSGGDTSARPFGLALRTSRLAEPLPRQPGIREMPPSRHFGEALLRRPSLAAQQQ
jgi:hypothetical protein